MSKTVPTMVLLLLVAGVGLGAEDRLTLEDSERIALAEHPTLRLAGEETRVADLRKDEAYRGIWPLLSVKGEITHGLAEENLGTPNFLEESYGFQMTQPLIQGGRLLRGYSQAKANWLSVKSKEQKARQEVLYNVRESYLNLVKAQLTEDLYTKALVELEKYRVMGQALAEKEVISRRVHQTILGQAEQASLNLIAAKAEAESRLWQWTAALGRTEPPASRPAAAFFPGELSPPALVECLSRAQSLHPDLIVQRYATEAARYGNLAGRGLYWPRLSVNGFYGRSGAAFENENFEFTEDWNFGAQLSQYFGGSSLNASGQEIKTSPKLGQSSRTQSRTFGGSLGILDSLKPKTEKAEAAYAYNQSAEELRQTGMNVANGVRDAYATFAKARSRRRIAETEVSVARTEYDVARLQSTNGELPISSRSLTRNELAQAEAALLEAEADVRIAAALLARAVGDPDLFKPKDETP